MPGQGLGLRDNPVVYVTAGQAVQLAPRHALDGDPLLASQLEDGVDLAARPRALVEEDPGDTPSPTRERLEDRVPTFQLVHWAPGVSEQLCSALGEL